MIKLNNMHKVFIYLAHNKPLIHISYLFNKKGREWNINLINFIPIYFIKVKFVTCKNHVNKLLNSTASTILKKRWLIRFLSSRNRIINKVIFFIMKTTCVGEGNSSYSTNWFKSLFVTTVPSKLPSKWLIQNSNGGKEIIRCNRNQQGCSATHRPPLLICPKCPLSEFLCLVLHPRGYIIRTAWWGFPD